MANYERYTPEFQASDGRIYGVKDKDAREAIANLNSALNTKADKIGTSPDLIAGTAEQLMSSDTVEDVMPYLYRKSGGGLYIGNRETLEKIVGGTVAWNQYLPDGARSNSNNGVTYTRAEKSPYVLSGTATGGNAVFVLTTAQLNAQVGHKYLLLGGISSNIWLSLSMVAIWGSTNPQDTGSGIIANANADGKFDVVLLVANGTSADDKKVTARLFDLTQMFGSTIADAVYAMEQATAGAGVAWFRKLFPADYYPYNAGELISVEGLQSHDMVGKNLCNPANAEIGTAWNGSANTARARLVIPCMPSMTYTISINGVNGLEAVYSSNGPSVPLSESGASFAQEKVFKTGAGSRFIVVGFSKTAITQADVDALKLQIEFGSDATEYEPYQKHSYSLDSSLTLRGIPKLDSENKLYYDGDEYKSDGVVTRKYGIVDLGTLAWYRNSNGIFVTSGVPKAYSHTNILCANYRTVDAAGMNAGDKCVRGSQVNNDLLIKDTAYTDVATFKAAMTGVMLIYELAAQTTETAEPYAEIQNVDPYGTEEFVSDSIVPVGHSTKYPADLVKKLEGLPWNFSALIAPTESTTTATQPYAVGSYLILNNTLYKVTSAIANGGTITPGTNVTATTIMAELAALA